MSWPSGVSDGLACPCADCGEHPRFDYNVADDFWYKWVPGEQRLGVVCLPCLDKRCGGVGLANALREIQWTGTKHTVVMKPTFRYDYSDDIREQVRAADRAANARAKLLRHPNPLQEIIANSLHSPTDRK